MPGLERLSRKRRSESPALHARMELHLLNQPSLGSASKVVETPPSQDFGGIGPSQMTTRPRFLQPTPPDGLIRTLPPTWGTWSHSCAAPLRRALRGSPPRSPIPPEKRHQRGVDGQLGFLPQVNPSAITSIPLITPKSRSRTRAFGVTLAPASRHTWAAAHSTGNPRFPKTPASEHAARCWP